MALTTQTDDLRKKLLGSTQPRPGGTYNPIEGVAAAPDVPAIEGPTGPIVQPQQPQQPSLPEAFGETGPLGYGFPGGFEQPAQPPGPIVQPPTPPGPPPTGGTPMPGGGIDPDTFNALFQQNIGPVLEQLQGLQTQFSGFSPTSPESIVQALMGSGGMEGIQGLLQQLLGGQAQTPGGEQFQDLQGQLEQIMQYMQGQQPQAGTGEAAAAGAAPPAFELTPEQISALFSGTGDASQYPGFMFGQDYFRELADRQFNTATQNPAQDLQAIMGDVIGAGPASMGDLGQVLAGRYTSPSVYEGDLGNEMLGAVRGLTNLDTGPAAQQYQNALSRLTEDRGLAQRDLDARLNQLGLFSDGQASGAVLPSYLSLQDTFGRLQNELTTNYSAQQAQREDAARASQLGGYASLLGGTQGAREAGSSGLAGLLGLQQAGQGQTLAGLSDLASQITGAQQNQLGALGNLSNQTFGQNMADIQLQNLFAQQDQGQKNQLLNELLGLTSQQGSQQFGGFSGGVGDQGSLMSGVGGGLGGAGLALALGANPATAILMGLGGLFGGM